MQPAHEAPTLDPEMQRDRAVPIVTGVALAAALVLITSQQGDADGGKDIDALGLALCLVTGLSLAFWRSHPLEQFLVAIGATTAYAALEYPGGPIYLVAFISTLAMVAERRALMPVAFAGGAGGAGGPVAGRRRAPD